MNDQTPGPAAIIADPAETGGLLLIGSDYPGQGIIARLNPHRLNAGETHALAEAAYSAFDKAGRELGIDAAQLARSVDLAALIRAAHAVVDSIPQDYRAPELVALRSYLPAL